MSTNLCPACGSTCRPSAHYDVTPCGNPRYNCSSCQQLFWTGTRALFVDDDDDDDDSSSNDDSDARCPDCNQPGNPVDDLSDDEFDDCYQCRHCAQLFWHTSRFWDEAEFDAMLRRHRREAKAEKRINQRRPSYTMKATAQARVAAMTAKRARH